MFVNIFHHQNSVANLRHPRGADKRGQHRQVAAPQRAVGAAVRAFAVPFEGKRRVAQRLPEMVFSKFVQRFRAEVSRQHRSAKSDYATLCQQAHLNGGEIAVAANKQRILLLAGDQRLPVNVRQ